MCKECRGRGECGPLGRNCRGQGGQMVLRVQTSGQGVQGAQGSRGAEGAEVGGRPSYSHSSLQRIGAMKTAANLDYLYIGHCHSQQPII